MRGLGNGLGAEMDVRDWLDGTGRCWRRGQAGEGGGCPIYRGRTEGK